ncbi:glycosyltransferase [Gorillibacterium massiliense]|uniref:glycosyltransferase n=1 Tax=Gorillibacterium massiliense TaxID=1280390 RepID=UPI0004B7DA46|nr:glycosyltransferase [Gorillibacterium massiliense]
MNKKISVIIPSYNHEKFIRQAVESVLNQSYKNIELIIIDDGSKDASWDYISNITDERVIKHKQENQGAHNAINNGLRLATGDFLTVLNSDDTFSPDRFQNIISEFEKDNELDFVCTYINIIDADGNSLVIKEGWHNCEPWPIPNSQQSYKVQDNFYTNIIMTNFVSTTSNMFFKRKIYQDIGGMRNLRFAHDWDYMLRLASKYKCKILKEASMNYRLHGNNTINTNRKWLLFEICIVLAANIDKFYGKYIFQDFSEKQVIEQSTLLFNSINLQGNDKVFWALKSYIDAYRKSGIENPEELLFDNKIVRDVFVNMIADDDENKQESKVEPKLSLRHRIKKAIFN